MIPAICVILALISLATGIAVAVKDRKVPGKEIGGFIFCSALFFAWFLFAI